MTHHLICLTVDTDPDGLSGAQFDRKTLRWDGLEGLMSLPDELDSFLPPGLSPIPITWFVRIDGQLRDILGDSLYLMERYAGCWRSMRLRGHELGWHPHLYRHSHPSEEPRLIVDAHEACDELALLWEEVETLELGISSFRNGEAWHHAETLAAVERFGLVNDSTAIPGRVGVDGHPMDWSGTPNRPFFPDRKDVRRAGPRRSLLELPMNSWVVKAPYDDWPKLRYMNPAVHEAIFEQSVCRWKTELLELEDGPHVWVLILHPDDVMEGAAACPLYSRSTRTVCRNLATLCEAIGEAEHSVQFATVAQAANEWRQFEDCTS